jgi:hypothetical protein
VYGNIVTGGLTVHNAEIAFAVKRNGNQWRWSSVVYESYERIVEHMKECGELEISEPDKTVKYKTRSGKAHYTVKKLSETKVRIRGTGYRQSLKKGCKHIHVETEGIDRILWNIFFDKLQWDYLFECASDKHTGIRVNTIKKSLNVYKRNEKVILPTDYSSLIW